MRKAATIAGETDYDKNAVAPLIAWADSVGQVFDLSLRVETLIDAAVASKEIRHAEHTAERIAFISHSSRDKPFVRRLASDLFANGVRVWLDEQQILVGDSVPEKIAQGLASSDFFLLVVTESSSSSPWVKKELSHALVAEIEQKKVTVLPLRIDNAPVPETVTEKLYAAFRSSYEVGFKSLLTSIEGKFNDIRRG